jgi:hypothetical protein
LCESLDETLTLHTMTSVVELPSETDAMNPAPVGPAQGWKFVAGETITLLHEDYRDLTVVAP